MFTPPTSSSIKGLLCSARGRVDDLMEEQKLKSPSSERVPFPWQPEVWGGNSNGPCGDGGGRGEEGEGEGIGEGGETAAQLREMLKTERDQKVKHLWLVVCFGNGCACIGYANSRRDSLDVMWNSLTFCVVLQWP